MANLGFCPFCSAPIPDRGIGGGIWSGAIGAAAASGPLLIKQCEGCGKSLVAEPTQAELAAGKIVWREEQKEYPGEEFVATACSDGQPAFTERIERLVTSLRACGFAARCPDHTFAGILVPSTQAADARAHLERVQIDYLRIWICDANGTPMRLCGAT